ncbi:DUF4062 domain-containing protein [Geodermatophilus sp. YIM 151500]|uniref:DUF4062 domain-containing protein n=1 Tax=Geodermatophilus sp. YIM 151500 TaxID=2984531 RepID=UPI0021E3E994|nr:DUF4062 domain-containing protein [Geodermatophilus sp. YIM 151500]MCV2491805.1 DUF4062 domain-containing protein [Geodermatophilus sp. YIM 151500]
MATIQTPDQRVRVFISSTMKELAAERAAVRAAVEQLHLTPVLFELGARPHPPKQLYLAYLRQSHVFVGIYGDQYGWVAPGESVSGLEDEYRAATGKPRLVYVRTPAPDRDPRLVALLRRIADDGLSYRRFGTPEELAGYVVDDLAVLLSERFGPAEAPPAPPPAVTPEPGRWRLPEQPDRLVGRAEELEELRRLLTTEDVRLVTLVGPGGIGKSRLALAAATEVCDEFPDGVVPVLLAATGSAEAVPAEIAGALGLPETFGRAPLDAVVDFLRHRRMLLLVDNFEQVVEAAPTISRILAAAAQVHVLVTSRQVLHLAGERVFAVPPLSVGDPGDPGSAVRSSAVELFVDRARAVRPDLPLDGNRLRVVAEICRRVDGLPLAIELAAARVRMLEPEVVLRRLDRRLVLLTGGPRDAARRQQALRATIEWSHDLLDERDRRLFRRLAVFCGGFFLDAAEEVCGDADLVVDVLDGLTSLVDKSLVRADPVGAEIPHFTLLDTVREYAAEALAGSGERERVEHRHADFFERLARASVVGLGSGPEGQSWPRLTADADNVRTALHHLLERGQPDRVVAVGEEFWPVWWGWATFDEGIGWMERARASAALGPAGRAGADFVRGSLAFAHGDMATARLALAGARAVHEELGDVRRAALDAILLGVVVALEDLAEGERLGRTAVAVLRRLGRPWQRAFAEFALGRVLLLGGRHAEAVPLLEESVRLAGVERQAGETGPFPLLGYAVLNLGWARLGLGDVVAARRAFRQAVTAAGATDRVVTARALEALAAVAVRAGDPGTGAVVFGAAEGVRRSVGVGVWVTDAATHAATETALRDALGAASFGSAVAEGLRLPLAEAVALACGTARSDPGGALAAG